MYGINNGCALHIGSQHNEWSVPATYAVKIMVCTNHMCSQNNDLYPSHVQGCESHEINIKSKLVLVCSENI